MPYPVQLDPQIVLDHLHELGYCNITGEQLKNFILDLKKLMKYEAKLNNKENCLPEEYQSILETGEENKVLRPCNRPIVELEPEPDRNWTSSSCSDLSETRSCFSVQTTSTYSNSLHSQKCSNRVKSDLQLKSAENISQRLRPQSSFIRPWRLHPQQPAGSGPVGATVHKSDPVSLYHKYQKIWKQQKVPGEANHAELRWQIREKMLGQDPNPRPTSEIGQESSHRRVNRI